MSSHQPPVAKVGILSIGDMGVGIAKLLIAHNFAVATNCRGRSQDTIERAQTANIEVLGSDIELADQCAVVLSVVPPREAEATAQRIIDALAATARHEDMYYADLNATAPSTSKRMAALFEKAKAPVRFIDGCILGLPPRLKTTSDAVANITADTDMHETWVRPRIPISGPHSLSALPYGDQLASILNLRPVSPEIGAASGLKMCFSALSKGFTAIVTQSFTTAHSLGVTDALKEELDHVLPAHAGLAEKSVPSMPPKAYRWVHEMEEIARTMSEEGGWDKDLFEGVAGIYRAVAEDDVLGREKIGKRTRGTSTEDVAAAMAEGLAKKRKKTV